MTVRGRTRRAVALPALLALLLGAAAREQPHCRAGTDCVYNGSNSAKEHFFKVNGRTLNISYNENARAFSVRCNEGDEPGPPPAADERALPALPELTDVAFAEFQGCRAPAGSYVDALYYLNVTVAAKLWLLYLPAESRFTRAQLTGLSALRELKLSGSSPKSPLRPEPDFLAELPQLRILRLYLVEAPLALPTLPAELEVLELNEAGLPAAERALGGAAAGPHWLARLRALRWLTLVEQDSKGLLAPPPLAELPLLEVASLQVPLAPLPARWLNESGLQTLSLISCGLSDLSDFPFEGATNLTTLKISQNNLTDLPKGVFGCLPTLESLDVSGNSLDGAALRRALLRRAALQREPALRELRANRNPLDSLCGSSRIARGRVSSELPRTLRRLELRRTGATRLCSDWIREATELAFIDLRDNLIDSLDYSELAMERGAALAGAGGAALAGAGGAALAGAGGAALAGAGGAALAGAGGAALAGAGGAALAGAGGAALAGAGGAALAGAGGAALAGAGGAALAGAGGAALAGAGGAALAGAAGAGVRLLLDGNPLRAVQVARHQLRTCQDHARKGDSRARVELSLSELDCTCDNTWLRAMLRNCSLLALADDSDPRCSGGAGTFLQQEPDQLLCAYDLECPSGCSCGVRLRDNASVVQCAGAAPDARWPGWAAASAARPLALRAPHAGLKDVPRYQLIELIAPNNSIAALDVDDIPDTLRELDLRYNRIARVSEAAAARLRDRGVNVSLAGNPFSCTCRDQPSLARLQDANVRDLDALSCGPGALRGRLLRGLLPGELCGAARPWLPWLLGGAAALALLAGAACALWGRVRPRIKQALFERQLCLSWVLDASDEVADPSKTHDAFVSYAHQDHSLAARVVRGLEARGYSTLEHCRDWHPGAAVAEHIARSVQCARRTLLLVSDHYGESQWALEEFRLAHAHALATRSAQVLLLRAGLRAPERLPRDLQLHLRLHTYLDLDDLDDPVFWRKLCQAMPPLGGGKSPAAGKLPPAPAPLVGGKSPRATTPPAVHEAAERLGRLLSPPLPAQKAPPVCSIDTASRTAER